MSTKRAMGLACHSHVECDVFCWVTREMIQPETLFLICVVSIELIDDGEQQAAETFLLDLGLG